MIKIHKIKIFALVFFASFLVNTAFSQATFAETDPNGNIIIDERNISLSAERIQEKKGDRRKEDLIKVAAIVIILAVGAVIYLNRSKIFKKNKHSRKK